VNIRRACALAAACATAATPDLAPAQTIRGADSVAVVQLRNLIRQSSPEVEARRAAVAVAEARVLGAGALGPAVLSAELEEVPDGFDVTDAGSFRLDLGREVAGGGRREATRATAGQAVARARVELVLAERGLLARAGGLLVQHLGSLAVAERLSAQDSLLAGVEEALTSRFAVGESRYVDVLRLRAERLRTRAEVAQARSEALRGRHGMFGLVEPADSVVGQLTMLLDGLAARAQVVMHAVVFPPAPGLDSLVAVSEPIQLAAVALREAEAGVLVAAAEQRARVNASVGVQRFEGDDGRHSIGPTIGASITLPFTAHGAGRATRLIAERRVLVARAEQRAALSAARASLRAALDRYDVAVANAALFEEGLMRGAREERENALAGYRTGALSLLELLDFERALVQAEVSQHRSRIAAAQALAHLLGAGEEGPHRTSREPSSGGEL
jgi:outer membrane protein TolC